jgi:hypothetical protein
MKLRVRHRLGVATIDIDANKTVSDLKSLIISTLQLPVYAAIEIKVSYPPTRLIPPGTNERTTVLEDLKLRSGEQLLVSDVNSQSMPADTRSEPASSAAVANGPASTPATTASRLSAQRVADEGYLVVRYMPDDKYHSSNSEMVLTMLVHVCSMLLDIYLKEMSQGSLTNCDK